MDELGNDIGADMKKDRQIAEEYLLNYARISKEYAAAKEDYLNSTPAASAAGGKSNLPGAPTEAKALRGAMYDEANASYLWLRSVEVALKTLGERKNIFIRVRREADQHNSKSCARGRRPWVIYTQRRYSEEIKKRFLSAQWLSEDTTRRWWREIVGRVVEIHLRISAKK